MRYSVCLLLLMVFFPMIQAQERYDDFSMENIKTLGLPVVEITTVGQEDPTCEFITHPEGAMGEDIINATKIPGRLIIWDAKGNLAYDSGEYDSKKSGMTIKINGNTSAYHNNRPYKIKLQKKADLLMRGDSRYEDKDWRLLKDANSLNTLIGLKIVNLVFDTWTPSYLYCNVFLNGDYKGCYMLIESIKADSDARIDVSSKGYLIERDPYWWNESLYFPTDYFAVHKGYRWTFKYPDEDDVTDEQIDYIQNYINQLEANIGNGHYEQYIDVESFAYWILVHDILGTWDSGGSNLYVSKYDDSDGSKLKMETPWDFDSNFWNGIDNFSRYHYSPYDYYFDDLFNNVNRSFVRAYKHRWNEISPQLQDLIMDYLHQFALTDEAKALDLSRRYYNERWQTDKVDIAEDINEADDWFTQHLPYLNTAIAALDETDGLSPIRRIDDERHHIYSPSGQRLSAPPHKGIYIKNGRKYIR